VLNSYPILLYVFIQVISPFVPVMPEMDGDEPVDEAAAAAAEVNQRDEVDGLNPFLLLNDDTGPRTALPRDEWIDGKPDEDDLEEGVEELLAEMHLEQEMAEQGQEIPGMVAAREEDPKDKRFSPCPARRSGGIEMQWEFNAPSPEKIKHYRRDMANWEYSKAQFNRNIPVTSPAATFEALYPLYSFGKFFTPWTNQKQEEQYKV
jgi:hypothetical protein